MAYNGILCIRWRKGWWLDNVYVSLEKWRSHINVKEVHQSPLVHNVLRISVVANIDVKLKN